MRRIIAATNAVIKCRNNDSYDIRIGLDGSQPVRDGDSLVLLFPNGDRLVLEGYFRKSVTFLVDGEEVAADELLETAGDSQPLSSRGSAVRFGEGDARPASAQIAVSESIGHLEAIESGSGLQAGVDGQAAVLPAARDILPDIETAHWESPFSEAESSYLMSLGEASGLGEIPEPDNNISGGFFREIDEAPISVAPAAVTVMPDTAGEEGGSGQKQEIDRADAHASSSAPEEIEKPQVAPSGDAQETVVADQTESESAVRHAPVSEVSSVSENREAAGSVKTDATVAGPENPQVAPSSDAQETVAADQAESGSAVRHAPVSEVSSVSENREAAGSAKADATVAGPENPQVAQDEVAEKAAAPIPTAAEIQEFPADAAQEEVRDMPAAGAEPPGSVKAENGPAIDGPAAENPVAPSAGQTADEPKAEAAPADSGHSFRGVINLPDGVVRIIRVVRQGDHGELVQREDGEWVYKLNEAINSGDGQGSNAVPEADAVYAMIEDGRGNKLRIKINVSIIDDVPELDIHGEGQVLGGGVLEGRIAYSYGADYIDYGDHASKHFDVASAVESKSVSGDFTEAVTIRGEYGVLTIQPNGRYSYKADHGVDGTDTFSFSITDADGDTVSLNADGSAAGLTFVVSKISRPEIGDGGAVVDEGVQPWHDGEAHGKDSGSFSVNLNAENGFIKVGDIRIGIVDGNPEWDRSQSFDVDGVRISVTGVSRNGDGWNVGYSAEYADPAGRPHGAPGSDTDDVLNVRIEISAGNAAGVSESSITVSVHDDIPVFGESIEVVNGKDAFSIDFGADGSAPVPFRLPDGTEPAFADGRYVFRIAEENGHPAGQLLVYEAGAGRWNYEFVTEGASYDFELPLLAVDGDGDTAEIALKFADISKIGLTAANRLVVDEGSMPYAEYKGGHEAHESAGTGSFQVTLTGGYVKFGNTLDALEEGSALGMIEIRGEGKCYFDSSRIMNVNGIDISITGVKYLGGDTYEISYAFEYDQTQDGQAHVDSNPLENSIAVVLTDKQGNLLTAVDAETGDEVPVSGSIDIEIHDDMTDIVIGRTDYTVNQHVIEFIDYADANCQTKAEFTAAGWTNYTASALRPVIANKGSVKIIGTTNRFFYNEEGGLDYALDNYNNDEVDAIGGAKNSYRIFTTTKGKGLGVGEASSYKGYDSYGGRAIASSSKNDPAYGEAISFEPANGTIHYGVTLGFSDFGGADRAIVSFYLTPQDNDDNAYVLLKTITADMLDETGHVHFDIKDGFTKFQLAAQQGADGSQSVFYVKDLAFTRDCTTYAGSVNIVEGADGLDGGLIWGLDSVIERLDGARVNVFYSLENTYYTLKCEKDGEHLAVRLTGNGKGLLNGQILFDLTLKDNGEWNLVQNYSVNPANLATLDIPVSVRDNDGTLVTREVSVDLSLSNPDRYNNLHFGYYNQSTGNSGVDYSSDVDHNKVADVIEGGVQNDLFMSRNGDDMLFGDGGFDNLMDFLGLSGKTYKTYNSASDNIARGQTGANQALVDQVRSIILDHKDDRQWLDDLSAAVDKAGGSGKDTLIGGLGNDILFGGAGDDNVISFGKQVSDGGVKMPSESNIIFAGAGNDIVSYNATDALIHGGTGIDFLLVGKSEKRSLQEILDSTEDGKPRVQGFEVMIKSLHTDFYGQLGITNVSDLGDYGLDLEFYRDSLFLGPEWTKIGEKEFEYVKGDIHLVLQTVMTPMPCGDGYAFGPYPVFDTTCDVTTLDGDNVLTIREVGGDVTLSGKVYASNIQGEGVLEVWLGGTLLETVATRGGEWSMNIPAGRFAEAKDGQIVVRLRGTDMNGDAVVNETVPDFIIDLVPSAKITVSDIPQIDGSNLHDDVVVSGRLNVMNGHAPDHVSLLINGHEIAQAVIQPDGNWSVTVSNSDLAGGKLTIMAVIGGVNDESLEVVKRHIVDVDLNVDFDINIEAVDDGTLVGKITIVKNSGEFPDHLDIYEGEEAIGSAQVNEDGTFTIDMADYAGKRLCLSGAIGDVVKTSKNFWFGSDGDDNHFLGDEKIENIVLAGDGNDIVTVKYQKGMSEAGAIDGGEGLDIFLNLSRTSTDRVLLSDSALSNFEIVINGFDAYVIESGYDHSDISDTRHFLETYGIEVVDDKLRLSNTSLMFNPGDWKNIWSENGTLIFERDHVHGVTGYRSDGTSIGSAYSIRIETSLSRDQIEFDGHWALDPVLQEEIKNQGLNPDQFDDGYAVNANYQIFSGENDDTFIYDDYLWNIFSGDGGVQALVELGQALSLSEGIQASLKWYAENPGKTTGADNNASSVYYAVAGALRSLSAVDGEKLLAEIEARHPDWNGNDWIYNGGISLGWSGDDYIHDSGVCTYAGSGNDIISLNDNNSPYRISGGSGIDTFVVGKGQDSHLDALLAQTGVSQYSGIEILLKATDVSDSYSLRLYDHAALRELGITITDTSLTLSDDWTSTAAGNGLYIFTSTQSGHDWILETVLDGEEIVFNGEWAKYSQAVLDKFDETILDKMSSQGLNPDRFDDGFAESTNYQFFSGENDDTFIYGSSLYNILSGDGGVQALVELGQALSLSESIQTSLKWYADNLGKTTGAAEAANAMYNAVVAALKSLSAAEGEKLLAEIEARHPEWNGNDWIYNSYGISLGWGGDDYIYNWYGYYIYAGSGNDIISLNDNSSPYRISGGSGIDTLVVGKGRNSHLDALLAQTGSYQYSGIEILLKPTDVSDSYSLRLYDHAALRGLGITITDTSLTLSDDWTSTAAGNGLYVFTSTQNDHDWVLETVLDREEIVFNGEWAKYSQAVLSVMLSQGVNPDQFDDGFAANTQYQIFSGENDDTFIYGNNYYNVFSGDGGVQALVELGQALNLSESIQASLKWYAENPGKTTGADDDASSVYNAVVAALKSLSAAEGEKLLAEIEARHPEWNGNDWIYNSYGISLGWGGDDYIYDWNRHYIYAGSGNDIIAFNSISSYRLSGGSGIDTLVVKNSQNSHLDALLAQNSYSGIDILLKATDVSDPHSLRLYDHAALRELGITITDISLTLSDDWTLSEQTDTLMTFTSSQAGHDWILETVLDESQVHITNPVMAMSFEEDGVLPLYEASAAEISDASHASLPEPVDSASDVPTEPASQPVSAEAEIAGTEPESSEENTPDTSYLVEDDSLDELLGADDSQTPDWNSDSGANMEILTEQEALVLEQAMRQVENQIS